MIAEHRVKWNHLQSFAGTVRGAIAGDSNSPNTIHRMRHITPQAALGALSDSRQLQKVIEQWEIDAVKGARIAGVPWAEIAVAAGVTRQAAWERWHEITQPLEEAT